MKAFLSSKPVLVGSENGRRDPGVTYFNVDAVTLIHQTVPFNGDSRLNLFRYNENIATVEMADLPKILAILKGQGKTIISGKILFDHRQQFKEKYNILVEPDTLYDVWIVADRVRVFHVIGTHEEEGVTYNCVYGLTSHRILMDGKSLKALVKFANAS